MFAIGDKVEILGPPGNVNAVKFGRVIQVNSRTGPQTGVTNLPQRENEPVYSVKLDGGGVVHYLTEQQIRKL
jgi:hypothetical protein